MAKKRTEKCCFESQYGGQWISAAQRLAEMVCERNTNGDSLPPKFWQDKLWCKIFIREVTHANKLLATPFAFAAIRRALESQAGRRVRTLGASFFRPIVELQQRQFEAEQQALKNAPLPEQINTLEKPRIMKRTGKSIREKLEDNGPTQKRLFDSESD